MGCEQISSLIWCSESSGLYQAYSDSLIFNQITVLTIFMFESQLVQMPDPRDIFCSAKAPGLGTHFGAKVPGCPGGGW